MRDKPFYDSALFWVALGGVVVTIGGILWSHGGFIAVVFGSAMLLWSLVLFLAHNHAEKHIQGYLAQRPHSGLETAQRPGPLESPLRSTQQSAPARAQAMPLAAHARPLERTWCELSPKELVRLFNQGATQLQSQSLVEAYIGQWRPVSGTVTAVEKLNIYVTSVSCTDSDQVTLSLFFEPEKWDAQLRGLMPGDSVKADGELMDVHKYHVVFRNCEIAE